jgi:hypothetical protein
VQRHLAGQRNHTYLILAMLVFEVGHRWLLDDGRTDQSDGGDASSLTAIAGAQTDSYR